MRFWPAFFLIGFALLCNYGPIQGGEAIPAKGNHELPGGQTDSLRLPKPGAQLIIGRSVQGRAIWLHRFGRSEAPQLLIIAGIHGYEAEGIAFAGSLISSLKELNPDSLCYDVFVLPLLNPDGQAQGTRRNANGVDLNRNFPSRNFTVGDPSSVYYDGAQPASEPETQVLLELVRQINPRIIISLHSPLACVNYDGPAETLARSIATALGLPLRESLGYSTPGSLGSWYGKDLGLPVITLELPRSDQAWEIYGDKLLRCLGLVR